MELDEALKVLCGEHWERNVNYMRQDKATGQAKTNHAEPGIKIAEVDYDEKLRLIKQAWRWK